MEQIELLIVDDQPVLLTGLYAVLHDHEDIRVIGEARDGRMAIEAVQQKKPDLVIMDIFMPGLNGIEATREIMKLSPHTKVLAFSMHSTKKIVKDMLDAGAAGFLLKDIDPDDIISAIHKVIKGGMYIDSSIISTALNMDEDLEKPEVPNILHTRLHRPPLTPDIIIRPRIIDLLERNIEKPFSLISAPAGYGKSMAVSMWLEQTKALHTWLSLDDDHNDLRIFLQYLQAAIEKLFPGSLEKTAGLLQAAKLPDTRGIALILINDLDRIEQDFILVLDDYHCIHAKEVHNLIDELIRFPPEHMHLSLLTRTDPPLRLKPLSAYERMTELRMRDLSFSDSEISELFLKLHQGTLEPGVAKLLKDKTEGWIVGLRMAFANSEIPEDAERIIRDLEGDSQHLSLFLLEEVLVKQPEEVQEFILRTAVLDRFCGDLIAAIGLEAEDTKKSPGGEEFFHWLIQSNLFIIALDDQGNWYRYHHLVGDLLKSILEKRKAADELSSIHFRASQWFEQHKHIEEAIHHMLAAGHPAEACDIVERHRMAELDDDRWYVVQRWIHKLPEDVAKQRPELLLAEAWGAYENFQLEKLQMLLGQVELLIKDNEEAEHLMGEFYLMNGLISHWSGQGKGALQYFQKAVKYLPENRKLLMGMTQLHIGLSSGITGKGDSAITNLTRLLSEEEGSVIYSTRLMAGLFYLNLFAGRLLTARKEARRIQRIADKHKIEYTKAMAICMEACSCFNSYELHDALDLLTLAFEYRYILHQAVALDAMAALSITHQLLQQPDEADKSLALLESFEKEVNQSEDCPISMSCRARISILRNDIAPALAWEETIREKPTFAGLFVWLEIQTLTQIRVLLASGTPESLVKADDLLAEFLNASREFHLINQTVEGMVLKSLLLDKQGSTEEALEILTEVIRLAEQGHFIRPFLEAGTAMTDMLEKLHRTGKESHFIEIILDALNKNKDKAHLTGVKQKAGPTPVLHGELSGASQRISMREQEIIRFLADGLRNKEIANLLFIAEGTVKKHVYNIF